MKHLILTTVKTQKKLQWTELMYKNTFAMKNAWLLSCYIELHWQKLNMNVQQSYVDAFIDLSMWFHQFVHAENALHTIEMFSILSNQT